jgi:hypothetical protein
MIRLKHLLTETTIETAIYWAKTFQADLGLTPEAASAMAANIQHESEFLPHRIQGSGVKTGTLSDSGDLGYSWAQWTYPARKQAYRDHVLNKFKVDIKKKPATNMHAYSFLKNEINNYPGFDFDVFKKSKDINAATEDFVTNYEQAGIPRLDRRQKTAQDILNKIQDTKVKVKVNNSKLDPKILKKQIYNKPIYVKKTNDTNFINVRDTAEVNNGWFTNKITIVKHPNVIGVARDVKLVGNDNWIYVKLDPSLKTSAKYGWVIYKYTQTFNSSPTKQFKQYIVKSGDTLSAIAEKNKTTISQIQKKNLGLVPDKIQVGQKLNL